MGAREGISGLRAGEDVKTPPTPLETHMQHNPITDEQLNQIEARLAAATDGPWGAYTFGGDTLIEIAADLEDTGTGYRARREICRLEDEPLDNDPQHREWTAEEDWAQVQADAEFIKHAPGDVAVLLAEVYRQRAGLAEMRATIERLRSERAEEGPVCVCGHPTRLHHEDVCLTQCGCADSLETAALPEALEAVLTKRFTALGNQFAEMRVHEQGPDGWPSSRLVSPRMVAEVLQGLLHRTAPDAPSGPAGGAVSAPQPSSGHRDAPDAPGASESRTGAP